MGATIMVVCADNYAVTGMANKEPFTINFPRIVACVNACAGVPTHILVHQGVVVKPPYDPFYPDKTMEADDDRPAEGD